MNKTCMGGCFSLAFILDLGSNDQDFNYQRRGPQASEGRQYNIKCVSMRLLFTIPHYFQPGGPAPGAAVRNYSLAADPEPRRLALTACLTALHTLFGSATGVIHHARREATFTTSLSSCKVDVVICTTGGCHLLERLPVAASYYTHQATTAEPALLGFACHTLLCDRLGNYDYYCYLEDDLVLRDPWHFIKLAWFSLQFGDDKLLQPNRFEAGLNHSVSKVYVDGDLAEHATAPFQNIAEGGPIRTDVLGVPTCFVRTLNPHAGCFFLNARQMEHWARQPHFHDRSSRFIGPLETAATLGIMRTFQVFKPAPVNAEFLEIQHWGTGYLEQLIHSS